MSVLEGLGEMTRLFAEDEDERSRGRMRETRLGVGRQRICTPSRCGEFVVEEVDIFGRVPRS